MKSSHGQLSSGFTNGLGCNNTDGLSDFNGYTMGKIPSVAPGADSMS